MVDDQIIRLRRSDRVLLVLTQKLNQAYEMAGLARQDRDMADSDRHLKEAERLKAALKELLTK
jgi:hypothetical protein